MNWKPLVAVIAVLAVQAIFVVRHVERETTMIHQRVKACELAHFGMDTETVDGRLEALQGQINDHDATIGVVADAIGEYKHRIEHLENPGDFDQLRADTDISAARIEQLETWAKEVVGSFPHDEAARVKQSAARKKNYELQVFINLHITDPSQRQAAMRVLDRKPADQWTYHEVRPLEGDPWVEWTEATTEEVMPAMPPRLSALKSMNWRATAVNDGVIWTEF